MASILPCKSAPAASYTGGQRCTSSLPRLARDSGGFGALIQTARPRGANLPQRKGLPEGGRRTHVREAAREGCTGVPVGSSCRGETTHCSDSLPARTSGRLRKRRALVTARKRWERDVSRGPCSQEIFVGQAVARAACFGGFAGGRPGNVQS